MIARLAVLASSAEPTPTEVIRGAALSLRSDLLVILAAVCALAVVVLAVKKGHLLLLDFFAIRAEDRDHYENCMGCVRCEYGDI